MEPSEDDDAATLVLERRMIFEKSWSGAYYMSGI